MYSREELLDLTQALDNEPPCVTHGVQSLEVCDVVLCGGVTCMACNTECTQCATPRRTPRIKGIEIAPEGSKCIGCWEPLKDQDRKGGASHAKAEVYSKGFGESQSLTVYLCDKCSKRAVSSIHYSKIGISILSDALEGGLRTLIRLNGELTKAVAE